MDYNQKGGYLHQVNWVLYFLQLKPGYSLFAVQTRPVLETSVSSLKYTKHFLASLSSLPST